MRPSQSTVGRVRPIRPLVVATAVVAAAVAPGCGDDDGRVTIAFRPEPGTELRYATEVESTTTTDLPCQPAETRTDRTRLDTTQVVLDRDGAAVRVEVTLSREGIGARTFVMRFDRAAQLTAIDSVEGIPAEALGDLGLSEIFPPAAGAPPEDPIAPGDRWTIDDEVDLGTGEPTRLRGEGRLVALGVVDGQDTATVESTTDLAVRTEVAATTGTRSLTGNQRSDVRAVYDLATGALRRSEAHTTGTFDLVLGPPPGADGDPCAGTLTVRLRSTVVRTT